jgi:hypothetical protein
MLTLDRKKRISVEGLLTWAYRDQMVHAAKTDVAMTLGPSRPPDGYRQGPVEMVDSSGAGGWFTALPDAFTVHGVVSGLMPVRARLPADVVARGGPGLSAGALPELRESFDVRRAALVMTHAIDGRRPDWVPEPCIVVERGDVIYARTRGGHIKRDKKTGAPLLAVQVVRFVGDMPWDVARARVVYSLWAAALETVRDDLMRHALGRFEVTDELPPAAPWGCPRLGPSARDFA